MLNGVLFSSVGMQAPNQHSRRCNSV